MTGNKISTAEPNMQSPRNNSTEPNQPIRPSRIAHFVIRTNRVAELVSWYKTVFHADCVFDNGSLAFLHFDQEHHRIAIGEVPGLEDLNPSAAGFDHVAFSYTSIGELLETYARLKGLGICPYLEVDHGPTTSFYYKDPDGNQIELQVDNFETLEDAHGYFKSDAFAKNPLGELIKADDLLVRYRAGEDPYKLLSSGTT
ncbi:MAG: VOC family protein [Pseudomonadota bacterium]